ncbi:mCG145754 [Mus musculus]|nr:mCG145754 [Mus musculus]
MAGLAQKCAVLLYIYYKESHKKKIFQKECQAKEPPPGELGEGRAIISTSTYSTLWPYFSSSRMAKTTSLM